jgi:glutamate:Na+ symporter, ESS family
VLTLKLNAMQVLALSCFGVTLGVWLKRRLPVLDRLNVPAAIVGGLLFATLTLLLRDRVANFEMDMVLRDILMVAFFTTIGMSASLSLVKKGGIQVVWFLGLATLGAIAQNGLGIGLAKLLGISPLLGIVSGSVALTGGPATALAFGATFEKMGVAGATTVGVASAMFGITAGGLLGGFIGGRLISRFGLKSAGGPRLSLITETASEIPDETRPQVTEEAGESSPLFNSIMAITVSMGLGTLINVGAERLGLVLPAYVGAMLVAAVIRNLDDWLGFARISERHVEAFGNIALYIFIVMALLTLRLWELLHLALPIVVLLTAQIVLVYLLCVLVFRAMGKDYEAAVMSGGFCGFMLGTTANAMACMGVLTAKHGPAPRAYIVVPLVGAFLIDFTNAALITAAANLVR